MSRRRGTVSHSIHPTIVRWPVVVAGLALTMTLLTWGFASSVQGGASQKAENALRDAGLSSVRVTGANYRTVEVTGPAEHRDVVEETLREVGLITAVEYVVGDVTASSGSEVGTGEQTFIDDMPLLTGVQFAPYSSQLTDGGRITLDRAASAIMDALRERPNLHIRVDAHTDDVGGEESNLVLSQEQADAVVAYLVSKGVPSQSLSAVGYGESEPLVDNSTAEGRESNRRIEFYITED